MQLIKTRHFKIGGKLCLHTPFIYQHACVCMSMSLPLPPKNPLGQQKDKPKLQTNNNIFPSQLIFVR